MRSLEAEIANFLADRAEATGEARQRAALHLACGMDLTALKDMTPQEAARTAASLDRAIERERQKGLRRHWSYDLDRHIALKQARDGLRVRHAGASPTKSPEQPTRPAPRRRRHPS